MAVCVSAVRAALRGGTPNPHRESVATLVRSAQIPATARSAKQTDLHAKPARQISPTTQSASTHPQPAALHSIREPGQLPRQRESDSPLLRRLPVPFAPHSLSLPHTLSLLLPHPPLLPSSIPSSHNSLKTVHSLHDNLLPPPTIKQSHLPSSHSSLAFLLPSSYYHSYYTRTRTRLLHTRSTLPLPTTTPTPILTPTTTTTKPTNQSTNSPLPKITTLKPIY